MRSYNRTKEFDYLRRILRLEVRLTEFLKLVVVVRLLRLLLCLNLQGVVSQ